MKTAFMAKIIFESDRRLDPPKEWTLTEIYRVIRENNFNLELVDDFLTTDYEPVIIIKEK